jgi:uncharacterized protein YndB with AHSA1/START domain
MDPHDFDPGPLAAVEYFADGGGWTVVFTRDLAHPCDKVWTMLTDPAQLRAWAPYTANRNLATTGPATLTMLDGQDTDLPPDQSLANLPAEVTRADAPTTLEYTWGTDRLRWQLDALGSGGTRLTLRHTVGSVDMIPKVSAGWHLCLVVAERALDGNPITPIVGEAAMSYGWQDLHDAYAKQLGITG